MGSRTIYRQDDWFDRYVGNEGASKEMTDKMFFVCVVCGISSVAVILSVVK